MYKNIPNEHCKEIVIDTLIVNNEIYTKTFYPYQWLISVEVTTTSSFHLRCTDPTFSVLIMVTIPEL